MKKKIYIAGPMSGYPEFNFPKFYAVQAKYEAMGWEVANPANKDEEGGVVTDKSYAKGDALELIEGGWDFREAYTWDADKVIAADAIYMIKGWEHSPGARGEWGLAVTMQTKYPGQYEIIYEN